MVRGDPARRRGIFLGAVCGSASPRVCVSARPRGGMCACGRDACARLCVPGWPSVWRPGVQEWVCVYVGGVGVGGQVHTSPAAQRSVCVHSCRRVYTPLPRRTFLCLHTCVPVGTCVQAPCVSVCVRVYMDQYACAYMWGWTFLGDACWKGRDLPLRLATCSGVRGEGRGGKVPGPAAVRDCVCPS